MTTRPPSESLEARGVTAELVGSGGSRFRLGPCSWRLAPGEIHGFVGESGAGKTTLARILAGLDRPVRGHLAWRGEPVWNPKPSRAFRCAVQYLPQDPAATLDPRMTLREAVAEAVAARRGSEAPEVFIERAGLPLALAHRRAPELSGGQRQRAGWARLLAVRPRYVLLDEPLTALDPERTRVFEGLIRTEREAGVGIAIVSHDLEVVSRLACRVAVLWRGRIVERGAPEQLRADPRHPYSARLWRTIPRSW